MKLWISAAPTPYGNEYGLLAVVAETRDEALAKAEAHLRATDEHYAPRARYVDALLDGLTSMREIADGVAIAWDAAERRR